MKTLTIDIESTGIPAKGHTYELNYMDFPYIVSIGYKLNDLPAEEFIINQEGRGVPKEASDINGITTEIANQSQIFLPETLLKLLRLGKPDFVIGHNIYFDTSIIKANVRRLAHKGTYPISILNDFDELLHKDKRIDTMRKGIKICGVGAYPKLSMLYSKLFNEEFKGHTGKTDCEATYKCYIKLKELGQIE